MTFRGRLYRVRIEITYAGGKLPDEGRHALESALRTQGGDRLEGLSLAVSPEVHSKVTANAGVRATSPIKALARLDATLDDALMACGLFEEFDVSGKTLWAAPMES